MAGKKRPPSRIIQYETYAEIILCNRKGNEIDRAIIDIEDVDKVKNNRWCKGGNYVVSHKGGPDYKGILLHRFILNCLSNEMIDHINQNPCDNRKVNLRISNFSINRLNSKISSLNKSGISGVRWNDVYEYWETGIIVNKKRYNLGYYKIKEDAIKARINAEELLCPGLRG